MVSHPENATVHKHLDARSHKGCIVAGSNPVLTTKNKNKEKKTKKMSVRQLTKKDYDKYMKVVNQNIEEIERRIEILDISRKISQLSFEDWVKFQNGELTIK